MPTKIRVWSPETEPPVAYYNELGQLVRGRFYARDVSGKPLPEGEEVLETAEVIRDIRRGHLTTKAPEGQPAPTPEPESALLALDSNPEPPRQE